MKTILITAAILVIGFAAQAQSQTKYTGYQYSVNHDAYYEFKYTREYEEGRDTYTTVYKIYHPTKGRHIITITAVHNKPNKKIKVDIETPGGGILARIRSEEISYEVASIEPFGRRGTLGVLGGNRVPNHLMVRFVSHRYENIKVFHIYGTEPGSANPIFYVLNGD